MHVAPNALSHECQNKQKLSFVQNGQERQSTKMNAWYDVYMIQCTHLHRSDKGVSAEALSHHKTMHRTVHVIQCMHPRRSDERSA
jgi:hypothetical protein